MHDPMTVAFEIPRPWPAPPSKLWPRGRRYFPAWVTIWHVDPEVGGSDDSCGWSYPGVPRGAGWVDALVNDVRFVCREDPGGLRVQREREGAVGWWLLWLHRASFHHRRRPLPLRAIKRFLYGESYPGNRDGIGGSADAEQWARSFARMYLDLMRPWWRHPRWHVRHWEIQVHPLLHLKRFLFSRCAACRGRFRWGYAPVTHQRNGTGPLWFRSERGVFHSCCVKQPGAVH